MCVVLSGMQKNKKKKKKNYYNLPIIMKDTF